MSADDEDDALLTRARAFVRARTSHLLPAADAALYRDFVPRRDAFLAHAIAPASGNPSALVRACGAPAGALLANGLFLAALLLGALSFVSQEYASAQALLAVDIKACAAPGVPALANFSRANCVADQLVSCASPFAGVNPSLSALPLAFTYRQTLHMVGFTVMLLASAALLACELVLLRLVITRRQLLAARILPYYAYLRHVTLPCAREPWDARRGGGQCCACAGGACRANRWGGLHCAGRSVPLGTVVPQLALIFLVFVAYYGFKTLSVWNVLTQNAWQSPQLYVAWGGKPRLHVNTVQCTLANGTAAVPMQLLLDVDGAVATLLGGGQLMLGVFPQVLLAVVLVLLAFVPALADIYSSDGDALAGVRLRGFVHCLEAEAGRNCRHHALLPPPLPGSQRSSGSGSGSPTLLRLGAAPSEPSVLAPSRFVAVEEALLDEVLWDLLQVRGRAGGGGGGCCALRWRFYLWPAGAVRGELARGEEADADTDDAGSGEVGAGEVLLEAALRLAHAEAAEAEAGAPSGGGKGGGQGGGGPLEGLPREARCEALARALRDALARRALPEGWVQVPGDAPGSAAYRLAAGGPTQAQRPTAPAALPSGWVQVTDALGGSWYERSDGHTQWERPTAPFA